MRNFAIDEEGASAAEFALVLPVLALLLFGFIHVCLMLYNSSQLHNAVEDAARCAVVRSTTSCTTAALTQAHATSQYKGTVAATFVSTAEDCGQQVTGSVSYTITLPLMTQTFPLTSAACYPY